MSNTSFMNFKMSFVLYERKWTKYIAKKKKKGRCRERLLIKRLFFLFCFFHNKGTVISTSQKDFKN